MLNMLDLPSRLNEEDRQAVLEKLREVREGIVKERDRVSRAIAAIEALCGHVWEDKGHVGPYTLLKCSKCGAEDLPL